MHACGRGSLVRPAGSGSDGSASAIGAPSRSRCSVAGSVTNLVDADVELLAGEVVLASGTLGEGTLPPDTTVWLRPAAS